MLGIVSRQWRRAAGIGALLAAVGALTAAGASAAVSGPTPPGTYNCIPAWGSGADSRIVDITFPYTVFPVRGPARARVLLPSDYYSSGASYPVIYLMHGPEREPTCQVQRARQSRLRWTRFSSSLLWGWARAT